MVAVVCRTYVSTREFPSSLARSKYNLEFNCAGAGEADARDVYGGGKTGVMSQSQLFTPAMAVFCRRGLFFWFRGQRQRQTIGLGGGKKTISVAEIFDKYSRPLSLIQLQNGLFKTNFS